MAWMVEKVSIPRFYNTKGECKKKDSDYSVLIHDSEEEQEEEEKIHDVNCVIIHNYEIKLQI